MSPDTQSGNKETGKSLDGVRYHSTGNWKQLTGGLMQAGGALRLEAGRRQEDEAGYFCNGEVRSSGFTRGYVYTHFMVMNVLAELT